MRTARLAGTLIRWDNSFPDIIVTLGVQSCDTPALSGMVALLRAVSGSTCIESVYSDTVKNERDKVLLRPE